MKFGLNGRAEVKGLQSGGCANEIFEIRGGIEASKSEVRNEIAMLLLDGKRLESPVNGCSNFGEVCSGLHAAPDYARLEFIGEESENAKINGNWLRGMDG